MDTIRSDVLHTAECKTVSRLQVSQGADSVALVGKPTSSAESCTVTQGAVIGTYALRSSEDEAQTRTGSVHLLSITRSEDEDEGGYKYVLSTKIVLPLPAVLDVIADPCPQSAETSLYAACADGALIRFSYECSSSNSSLHRNDIVPPKHSATLNLSIHAAYSISSSSTLIASSDSHGYISIRRVTTSCGTQLIDNRRIHDCEAWTVHVVDADQNPTVVSGGDDGVLAAFQLNDPTPCWKLRRSHGGVGVTCVTAFPHKPHELWTGGYDDHIRVWDIRNMRRCVGEQNVSGGVWRIKFHPNRPDLVVLATMYDGFKVIQRETMETPRVVAKYKDHHSIAYGAEWVPSLDENDNYVALTASFYDCAVRLWTYRDNEDRWQDRRTYRE